MLVRKVIEHHPVGGEKLLNDHHSRSSLGHCFKCPVELIGAVNQNRHQSNTGSRGCHLQAFHESLAVTAVCGWGCRENPNTVKLRGLLVYGLELFTYTFNIPVFSCLLRECPTCGGEQSNGDAENQIASSHFALSACLKYLRSGGGWSLRIGMMVPSPLRK